MKKSEIIRLTAFVLIFVLLNGVYPAFSEGFDEFGLMINDAALNNEIKVSTLEGITYVPLNKISGSLGIKISEDEKAITISRLDTRLVLKIQQGKAYPEPNGASGSGFAYKKEGIIYIPVIFLVDYLKLGVEVLYDIKCIRITTKSDILLAGQIYSSGMNPSGTVKQAAAADGGKAAKVAYLTFDDGLDSKVTPQILDTLELYNVKATFFIIGNTVSKNKGVLERIIAEGHSVGNHSYTHNKDIIYTDVDRFAEELAKTSKVIYDTVGVTTTLFRPPYGAPYIRGQEYKDALSQYKTVLWNVDSMDSRVKGLSSDDIAAGVMNQVKNKREAIILFHSTGARGETAKALPEIIQYLLDNGYVISSLE